MRKATLLAALALLLLGLACGQKGDPHPRKELHRPGPASGGAQAAPAAPEAPPRG